MARDRGPLRQRSFSGFFLSSPRHGEDLTLEVGVFGATGYAGREVVRCLARHPRASVRFTTGTGEGHLPHEEGLSQKADAYFLSMPHGVSARYAAQLRRERPEAVIVDLSGDLRLPDAASYRRWYGHDHPAPELLDAPYGLTELFRDRIRGAASWRIPAATRRPRSCRFCLSSHPASSTPTTSSLTLRAAPQEPAARCARLALL